MEGNTVPKLKGHDHVLVARHQTFSSDGSKARVPMDASEFAIRLVVGS
jgi:hypothetical protein